MSFRMYKFCQNGLITFISSLLVVFYIFFFYFGISWWISLLLSIVLSVVPFIPPIGMIYPQIFAIYMIVAIIMSFSHLSILTIILLGIFLLHCFRFVAMLSFAKKHPEISRQYDYAIRMGYKLK